jgi:peptidoglycan DL-endopeptidase CwlO
MSPMSGLAVVAARIATIESRFGVAQPAPAAATAAGTSRTFAAELASAGARLTAGAAGAAGPASATGQAPTADNVVALAEKYLGVPYVWGGTDPAKGLDCSGLVQLVFRQVGIDLPRVSRDQATTGVKVDGLANARPGDLLAFDSPVDHIGIYIGGGRMIHAPRTGKDVEISPVYETPTAIRRVLPDAASASLRTGGVDAGPATVPYAAEFARAEAATGVPARVLAAVARAESNFRADAVSPAGARGLMQFMPATAAEMNVNPFDPASAIDGAARLLRQHLKDFGSLPLALAAYNAGPGAVRKYGGIPPYAETQAYVEKIMADLGRTV